MTNREDSCRESGIESALSTSERCHREQREAVSTALYDSLSVLWHLEPVSIIRSRIQFKVRPFWHQTEMYARHRFQLNAVISTTRPIHGSGIYREHTPPLEDFPPSPLQPPCRTDSAQRPDEVIHRSINQYTDISTLTRTEP